MSDSFRLVKRSRLPPLADRVRRLTARYLRLQTLASPFSRIVASVPGAAGALPGIDLCDPRSLRLLLFQAPVVGIFLLLGFMTSQYRTPMPLLRELTPKEREVLTSFKAVGAALDDDRAEAESLAVLEKSRFHVSTKDANGHRQQREVTGKELLRLARDLRDPEAAIARQRDAAEINLEGPNKESFKITGRDLDEARKLFAQQEQVRKLLGLRVDNLNAVQKAGLEQMRVQVRIKDLADHSRYHTLNGLEILTLLDQYDRTLDEWRRSNLDDVQIPLPTDGQGEPVVLTGKQLVDDLRALHHAGVAEKMLKIEGPVVPAETGVNPRYTYTVLFILVMIVVWFGCNNAAKEIVKEEAVFARERAVNLGIVPYVASKFLVLSFTTTVQSLLLMVVLFGTLQAAHAVWPTEFTTPPSGACGFLPRDVRCVGFAVDVRSGVGSATVGVCDDRRFVRVRCCPMC